MLAKSVMPNAVAMQTQRDKLQAEVQLLQGQRKLEQAGAIRIKLEPVVGLEPVLPTISRMTAELHSQLVAGEDFEGPPITPDDPLLLQCFPQASKLHQLKA